MKSVLKKSSRASIVKSKNLRRSRSRILQERPLGTKERVLVVARGLLQKYGYSGFSFQHIADAVGLQKPSLYDHYPSKEKLGEILIEEYHEQFQKWVQTIEVFQPGDKVNALFEMFYNFSKDGCKFCPLTALTAEANALPAGMKSRLKKMHRFQKQWLIRVIQSGKKSKSFQSRLSADALAESILSMAYGAQLSARISNDPACIRRLRKQALLLLQAA